MKLKLIVLYFFIIFKPMQMSVRIFEEKVLSIPTPASGVVSDGQQPKYDTGIFLEKISIIIKNYFLKEIKITINLQNLF